MFSGLELSKGGLCFVSDLRVGFVDGDPSFGFPLEELGQGRRLGKGLYWWWEVFELKLLLGLGL
jgi:hypothetical protein